MIILRDKTIDLASITDDENIIRNITGSTLSFQIDGDATLSVNGSHSNFESENDYALAIVNMTTLDKSPSVTGPGIFMVIVTGIDEVTLSISGSTGVIHWKELGD